MQHRDYFKKTMKAHALGAPEFEDLAKGLPEDGDWGLFTVTTVSVMLEKALNGDTSVETIKNFVEKVRYAYRKAEPPANGLVIEGFIRGLLGEEHFLDDITPEQQHDATLKLIYFVTQTDEDVYARIDSYLEDAASLAEQWASEGDQSP